MAPKIVAKRFASGNPIAMVETLPEWGHQLAKKRAADDIHTPRSEFRGAPLLATAWELCKDGRVQKHRKDLTYWMNATVSCKTFEGSDAESIRRWFSLSIEVELEEAIEHCWPSAHWSRPSLK
jgi:hypothetical protein